MKRQSYVYILTNFTNTVLYIGVTEDLRKRVYQHKNKLVEGFTSRYNVTKLVYYEVFSSVVDAISREKQLKAGPRRRKTELIRSLNPEFIDLYPHIIA